MFRRVTLDGADFTGAALDRAEFLDGRAAARFTGAGLIGTRFRAMVLDDADLTDTRLHRTKWLRCRMRNAHPPSTEPPAALFALCEPEKGPRFEGGSVPLEVLDGHRRLVDTCAYSPDGARIASAGGDRTLRLWDAASGEALAVLRGHDNAVWSCAFSPDGTRIASAGDDGSLRLWDLTNGQMIHLTHIFTAGGWATIDRLNNRLVEASGDAWRWLQWVLPTPGGPLTLPAEVFGPLPAPTRLRGSAGQP